METGILKEQEVKVTPELRFWEFEEEWKKIKLGEIAQFFKGKNISKADINFEGRTECIRYGELYTFYKEKINEIKSRTNLKFESLFLSEVNDVIIPASGETPIDIATAACVLKEGVALGGDLNVIRSNTDGLFLAYYLSNRKKIDIAKLSQGNSVVHLYSKQLKLLKLNLPSISEQQKIASFLSAVDKKIQQLTRKKELLETYKKGVMQQLFSQEIRFKDEDGKDFPEWEVKPLGKISSNISYGMNSASKDYDGKNKYVRITDIDDDSRELIPNSLTSPDGDLNEKYLLRQGDLLFARTGASVGKSYLQKSQELNNYFAGFLIRFSIKDAVPYFVYSQTLTQRYRKWVMVMSMRSGQPGINAEEYKLFKIFLPVKEEQQKIADFLSAIDKKIEAVSQQIEKTQNFKKGLLQQMFV